MVSKTDNGNFIITVYDLQGKEGRLRNTSFTFNERGEQIHTASEIPAALKFGSPGRQSSHGDVSLPFTAQQVIQAISEAKALKGQGLTTGISSQKPGIIMEKIHGDKAGAIFDLTNRCEELFAKTVLAGIDKSSCPPAHPKDVDADTFYDPVIRSVSIDLEVGNINISVSDAPEMCSIDFGSHDYKPDSPAIAIVCSHLTAKGFEVLQEGSSLNFSLNDSEQISALRTFAAVQKERNQLISWKSRSL